MESSRLRRPVRRHFAHRDNRARRGPKGGRTMNPAEAAAGMLSDCLVSQDFLLCCRGLCPQTPASFRSAAGVERMLVR